MTKPRILDVGQCGLDHGNIARYLSKSYGAEVALADTKGQAMATLRTGEFDLVLVNRVLDLDGTSGLDVIRAIKSDPDLSRLPVMLVSNFPEAQAEARTLGALPGFGKADLRSGSVTALDDTIGQTA
jgi:two-component system chemotaxis response regulator CheY